MWHDPQRNLLIYEGTPPSSLPQLVPELHTTGGYTVVPRSLHACQALRHVGLPVPPIMDGYDWPHAPGITPYETQKLAANFLVLHPHSYNFSSMGAGKTLSSLWAADWLMRREKCRALIVSPLSILQRVWADAIFKHFLGKRTFVVLHGDHARRLAGLNTDVDFYIVNFDGVGVGAHTRKRFELDGFSRALAERSDIRIAIVDEASAYRDATTKRHRIARIVLNRDYLWLLTGTPTPNAPTDAYGLAKLVSGAGGKSFKGFREETMTQITPFKWVARNDGYEKARALLQPAIRIDIKDVWDGPPVTTQQREVPLTVEQKRLMADLKRDLQVEVASGRTITAVNEAAYRTKYLQISMGAIYDQDHRWHSVDAEPRYRELESVLEEASHKVVVFIPLTSVIQKVYAKLHKRWEMGIINGEVPKRERDAIISRFATDSSLRVVVCDPGCTAHGINEFVVADTVVWFGAIDKGELYQQGVKRVDRPGQRHPVTVVQIVSNALEREIFRRLEAQETMQGALLEAVRRGEL